MSIYSHIWESFSHMWIYVSHICEYDSHICEYQGFWVFTYVHHHGYWVFTYVHTLSHMWIHYSHMWPYICVIINISYLRIGLIFQSFNFNFLIRYKSSNFPQLFFCINLKIYKNDIHICEPRGTYVSSLHICEPALFPILKKEKNA